MPHWIPTSVPSCECLQLWSMIFSLSQWPAFKLRGITYIYIVGKRLLHCPLAEWVFRILLKLLLIALHFIPFWANEVVMTASKKNNKTNVSVWGVLQQKKVPMQPGDAASNLIMKYEMANVTAALLQPAPSLSKKSQKEVLAYWQQTYILYMYIYEYTCN